MADKRKLQLEIDRCLKTVGERLEIFQETWDKVGGGGCALLTLTHSLLSLNNHHTSIVRSGWLSPHVGANVGHVVENNHEHCDHLMCTRPRQGTHTFSE
jgi:hypothetical protein